RPSRPADRSRAASFAGGVGLALPGARSLEAAGDFLLNAAGRVDRIRRGADRAADDDVVRTALERGARRHDATLVVAARSGVRGANARRDDQCAGSEVVPEPPGLVAGRDHAIAAGGERIGRATPCE